MYYYKVWVASQRFHGVEPLTYAYEQKLLSGHIVSVPLRSQHEIGIIVSSTTKPKFSTKSVAKLLVSQQIPSQSLALLSWLRAYYPGPSGILTGLFLPPALLSVAQNTPPALPKPNKQITLPPLTTDQTHATKHIMDNYPRTVLLHGETGTGKTRVYIELAKKVLMTGKSVLVLTPEIGLTSPLVDIFQRSLSAPVLVIHSQLTPKERRDAWLQILYSTEPLVVIGPRSALFSPFQNLGLVVMDEAHDAAYKQGQAPHYQSIRVAAKLTELNSAQLLLGSATPRIEDYYLASRKEAAIVTMTTLAKADSKPPHIEVVNSRERQNFGQTPFLSDQLLAGIRASLSRKEQSLVFLNRRGTARIVLCQSCGWQATCQNCDLPLTYHADKHVLRCHTCGFVQPPVTSCPNCASTELTFRSIGTKALAESLQQIFPDAVVRRFDTDNLKDDRFETQYQSVLDGKVDIIVGTQLLIKGHDIPGLSMVGVVAAESSLYFPDYTADELTYQLIRQVIGRVGRGHRDGYVVIQALNPENETLQSALNGTWQHFYEKQLTERQQFKFAPFVQSLKLSCGRASSSSAQKAATALAATLRELKLPIEILGPTPRFIQKSHNKFHWQLIIKARTRKPLLEVIKHTPANWVYDLDPSNLL